METKEKEMIWWIIGGIYLFIGVMVLCFNIQVANMDFDDSIGEAILWPLYFLAWLTYVMIEAFKNLWSILKG